jgi:hypothetical protein
MKAGQPHEKKRRVFDLPTLQEAVVPPIGHSFLMAQFSKTKDGTQ